MEDLCYYGLMDSANIVLMVHRPEFYKGCDRYYGEVILNRMFVSAVKNESGPAGTIALDFNHDNLTLSQTNLTGDDLYNLNMNILMPLPNAGDDPNDLVPEYEGQEKEEIKAWHRAQNLIKHMSYESDDIKQLVEKLGLELD